MSLQTRAAAVKHGCNSANAPSQLVVPTYGTVFLDPAVRNIDSHPAFRQALKSHYLFHCASGSDLGGPEGHSPGPLTSRGPHQNYIFFVCSIFF